MVKGTSRQVIVVDAPEPKLFEQAIFILKNDAVAREGISEDYARLRIGAQKSNDVFAANCGVTIYNSFDSAELFLAHCKETFQQLLKEDVQP